MPRQLRSLLVVVLAASGAAPVVADDTPPKPGDVREFEIATGVKMKFCWIPPGHATLGSPASEKDRDIDKAEHEYKSKGYWLGKYPVTQGEWQAVMGNNPSWLSKDGGGKEKVAGMDTNRFPVETVSWIDCGKFLDKLNERGGMEKVFRKRGKFVLPHEDEWEYACRGGRGNSRPFYFGDVLNGRQANCDGNSPYGTDTKGPYKGRTTEVGEYESEAPHPWGLCDMHGNVWQWCENWYDSEQKLRVLRGGSWFTVARICRAACHVWGEPGYHDYDFGFRICFRLD